MSTPKLNLIIYATEHGGRFTLPQIQAALSLGYREARAIISQLLDEGEIVPIDDMTYRLNQPIYENDEQDEPIDLSRDENNLVNYVSEVFDRYEQDNDSADEPIDLNTLNFAEEDDNNDEDDGYLLSEKEEIAVVRGVLKAMRERTEDQGFLDIALSLEDPFLLSPSNDYSDTWEISSVDDYEILCYITKRDDAYYLTDRGETLITLSQRVDITDEKVASALIELARKTDCIIENTCCLMLFKKDREVACLLDFLTFLRLILLNF